MANILNTLAFGDSSQIQFLDDGTLVFRPKHGATVAGLEMVGYLQLDQQAAPAVAPSGSARLYFDTSAQTIQQSIAGGAYATLVTSPTSISQGGGSVAVDASGNITATPSGTGSTTISGGAGGSIIASAAGAVTINPLSGQGFTLTVAGSGAILIRNTGAGTLTLTSNNASGGITLNATGAGMTFNGPASSLISISSTGAISITTASATTFTLTGGAGATNILIGTGGGVSITGQAGISLNPGTGFFSTCNNFTPVTTAAGMTYALPPLGPTGAAVTVVSAAANLVVLYLVYIPTTITVGTIIANVTTGVGGAHLGIGLYTYAASQASASKLIDITLSAAATAIVSGAPNQGATIVPAGWYWLAWTVDTASSVAVEGYTVNSLGTSLLKGGVAGSRIMAVGATASAAGVLPASTGAISATTQTTAPLVLFGQ